ncbi:reverse transcriptase domain-containing protein [Tanacetum coccineum]
MRTRNSNFPNNSNITIPRRRNRGRAPNIVEPELRTIVEIAPMAERTMEELLRAPTEGENPHAHINSFKRITSTLRFRDVPNDVIKLMMFPYSLEGNARLWYKKEPPNSILTWEDLVTKFVNQFFPPSKTTHLKNEISRFTQKFEETFSEAWERFKEMLRACPHHGFTELTQVDTFYNGLNENDQDSLNSAAGGNLLSKTTSEALNIIENKSKVRYSRNKSNVSRMNTTSRESVSKTDERIDKLADQLSTLVEIVSKKVVTPAPVKAVEEICVTCSGPHAWYNCPNTDNNQASVCAATGSYNQVNPQNRVSNQMAPPGFAPVQNNSQNRFNPNQAWLNLSMTYENAKQMFGHLIFDDLYNKTFRVLSKISKLPEKTSSSAQKVAFVSKRKSRRSTNKVKSGFTGTYSTCTPSTSSTNIPEKEALAGFADEGTHDGKKKRDSFYQHQEAGKQEKNQMGLLTMDDGIVNWGEHTEDEETNHALMAISSSSEANEIYEKDEKLKKYRRIGMKAVKEKEQLQKTLDSWKDSSKNLWRLINSGMSSNSKVGLGYEIQSNNEVLSYEEEMNFSVFKGTEEDLVGKPLYSRFIKTNDFKGVPHPLSGDYNPRTQKKLMSLYKPLKNMVDRGIFDSGCSGHMTGNKDQLEDFEEFNRGICYLWSFDMKTPTPAKGFACLIAKATYDESKLWHRRLGRTWDLQCKAGVISSLFFKQFWQTAIANTLADGTLELHATIDTTVYTITKASIRNKLQLADASGITLLQTIEIFEGMGHMGGVSY